MNYRNINYSDPEELKKAFLKLSCASSTGGSGGISEGSAITGATANAVVHTNASSELTTSANFLYTGTAFTLLGAKSSFTGITQTGSSAEGVLDLFQTWNTTGTPTAFKIDVLDTASNANSNLMNLLIGGSSQFRVSKNGNLFASGALTSNSSIYANAGAVIGFSSSTRMYPGGINGNLVLQNNAGTDFGRLMFGGITPSFPALLRAGIGLDLVLADGSAYTNLRLAKIGIGTAPGGYALYSTGAISRINDLEYQSTSSSDYINKNNGNGDIYIRNNIDGYSVFLSADNATSNKVQISLKGTDSTIDFITEDTVKATLQTDGDFELKEDGKGIIVISPDGLTTRRIGIDNSGAIAVTVV